MPDVVGELIFAALGAAEVGSATAIGSITYATIVGDVVLATASIGGALLLNKNAAQKPQDGQQIVQQAAAPRRRNYGLVKVGGAILFSEVANGSRFQLIALNQGEIDSFINHYFDENLLGLDGGGNINGSTPVTAYRVGSHSYTQLFFGFGTDHETAFGALTSTFSSFWTAAHQGNGFAKVLTYIQTPASKDFSTVYPGGAAPVYRAVIQSAKVWDPRDPFQDRSNKATWKYSTNPVLHALDYHRVPDGMGLAVFDRIFFTDAAIADDWIPAANICDEQIPLKAGGSIPRYSCAGGYELSAAPKTVLASILSTCDGQTYQRADGAIGIRVGKTVAPTVTLDDDDIIGYDSLRRGAPDSLVAVDQVTAKYTASLFDFQENDAEPWIDEDGITAAAGKIESRDLDLRWVYQHPQARRLMKIAFKRFTPEWSGKIITGLSGLRAWGERFIRVVISELGIDDAFEVTSFSIDPATLTCSVGISSFDQSAYDWDPGTEEGSETAPPDQNDGTTVISDPTSVGVTATGHVMTITWGVGVPAQSFVVAEVQYSLHGANNWFEASVDPTTNLFAVTPVLPAGSYDVQVSFVSGTLRSNWVPAFNISV